MLSFIKTIEWITFLITIIILLSYIVWNIRVSIDYQNLQDTEKISTYECGFLPFSSSRIRFDIKYFIVAILFLIFDLEVAWIFPLAINWNLIGYTGLIVLIKFLLILFVGLCYEISLNILDWSTTNQNKLNILLLHNFVDFNEITQQLELNLFVNNIISKILTIYLYVLFILFCYIIYKNFVKIIQKKNNR